MADNVSPEDFLSSEYFNLGEKIPEKISPGGL